MLQINFSFYHRFEFWKLFILKFSKHGLEYDMEAGVEVGKKIQVS